MTVCECVCALLNLLCAFWLLHVCVCVCVCVCTGQISVHCQTLCFPSLMWLQQRLLSSFLRLLLQNVKDLILQLQSSVSAKCFLLYKICSWYRQSGPDQIVSV